MSPTYVLPLSDWNWAVLMLNQALIGAISPNFRMVELTWEGGSWVVTVTLAEDRDDDREAVEDICADMSCYLMDLQGRISKPAEAGPSATIVVSKDPIFIDPASARRLALLMRQD